MIKEGDGVEDLVVSYATGHVEVGQGSGIHSGGRWWQCKAHKLAAIGLDGSDVASGCRRTCNPRKRVL